MLSSYWEIVGELDPASLVDGFSTNIWDWFIIHLADSALPVECLRRTKLSFGAQFEELSPS